MEKWGGMREKVGRGEDKGGMRDGRGVDPKREMEEGVSEGEKGRGSSPKKLPEIGFETGKGKKKWTTQGKKRA